MIRTDVTRRRGNRRRAVVGMSAVILSLAGLLTACDTTPIVLGGTLTADGAPAPGVVVEAFADGSGAPTVRVVSDAAGHYRVRAAALPDGTYRLRFGRGWYGGTDRASATPVAVSVSSPTGVDAEVAVDGVLTGTVVSAGAPVDGAVVAVVSGALVIGVTTTDPTGGWSLPVTTVEPVTVAVVDPAQDLPRVWIGGTDRAEFTVGEGTVTIPPVDVATGSRFQPDHTIVTPAAPRADGNSGFSSISADGRFVAFDSYATNLVAYDTNGEKDVFVADLLTGTTTRVSVASDGSQGDRASSFPSISADGHRVAFVSDATNLVPGDTNARSDVFVHDLATGATTRVSVASDGTQADDLSSAPAISADGRSVAFDSRASNLVSGDTDDAVDVFVRDVEAGVTSRVSVTSDGSQIDGSASHPSISADGRWVAFESSAPNLVPGTGHYWSHVHVHDRHTGTTTLVSASAEGVPGDGGSYRPVITPDGRHVAFWSAATNLVPGDTGGHSDVFVRDLDADTVEMVSVSSDGTRQDDGCLYIALPLGISADGNRIVFDTLASNLDPGDDNGDLDVYVRDRAAGTTTLVSVTPGGVAGGGLSSGAAISADGRHVGFTSSAPGLVPGGVDDVWDVFVRDLPDA